MYRILRDAIYLPFAKVGFICVVLAYLGFLVYNMVTPGYAVDAFFTNPSAFVALKFLPLYLILAALITMLIAAALFAYIEVGRYKQQVAFLTEKRTIFEVRLPEDTQETLVSMEALLEMIAYSSGEGLWFPVWWGRKKRPMYSFEIMSKGGIVTFLVHTRAAISDAVRSAIYSFYPKAQVTEADDYVYDFEYDEKTHNIFSFEWKFKENNALPIKTYIEFQLERPPQMNVELQGTPTQPPKPIIDPLAPLYDLFGSIVGEEQMWIQYIFRTQRYSRTKEKVADDPLMRDYWKKQKLPEEIYEALVNLEKKIKKSREDGEEPMVLTASQRRLQTTGVRLMDKQALEVGIRVLYTAPKDQYDGGRTSPLLSLYRLTNTQENSLAAHGTVLTDASQIPAFEGSRKDKNAEKRLLLQLYRDRLFWYAPALLMHQIKDEKGILNKFVDGPTKKRVTTVMTTETLATICHFPTVHVKTPTVARTLSTAVEPPQNLPV